MNLLGDNGDYLNIDPIGGNFVDVNDIKQSSAFKEFCEPVKLELIRENKNGTYSGEFNPF
jgi:hypothetical protein